METNMDRLDKLFFRWRASKVNPRFNYIPQICRLNGSMSTVGGLWLEGVTKLVQG